VLYNVPVYNSKTQINSCVKGDLILLSKRCYLCCRFRYSVLISLFTNISGFSASLILELKRARGRPKKNWMEDIRKAMNEGNLNEGQWEDRKQWSLGVGQRRKTF